MLLKTGMNSRGSETSSFSNISKFSPFNYYYTVPLFFNIYSTKIFVSYNYYILLLCPTMKIMFTVC